MEYPLEKYKRFIKNVERRRCARIKIHRLAQIAKIEGAHSHNVVAKVLKSSKGFSIRYIYEGFRRIYVTADQHKNLCSSVKTCVQHDLCANLWHKLKRINSRNELTHRVLKAVIKHQREYLKTGSPINLVPVSQVELTEWINGTGYEIRFTRYDNSWTSRLVNRLSIITPSGEEKPLRWFFQTQKDVNKRFIKQLLDKENEDLQSGALKRPYTDNELKGKLEALLCERIAYSVERIGEKKLSAKRYTLYANKISRHSIGHCRKDMGIPPAKKRLSGYKYPPLSANFSLAFPLTVKLVTKYAPEKSGIYELSTKNNLRTTNYGLQTNVFYIGSTRNIKKRLKEHLGKNSKNGRIKDFLKKYECFFRYIMFKKEWQEEEKKLYKLFVDTYGSAPGCNRIRP